MILRGRASAIARALALVAALSLFGEAATAAERGAVKPGKKAAAAAEPRLEPKAIDLLKASSSRLAAAKTMQFTATVYYEHPSLLGPPLVYTTKSDVVVQRPDKLRVVTLADGPPSEFYYDGKTMTAFAPMENLVAVAEAPPTIDGALKAAFDDAAIYYPFTDVIVADPYGDLAPDLKLAFYIGQSQVVGGTTTDMLAYATDQVFVQIWIGVDDKLPRMMRALYRNDPSRLRHAMELGNWQLDAAISADVFGSAKAAQGSKIDFARPEPPPAPKSGGKAKAAKQPSKSN